MSNWRYYNHALVPTTPPHEEVDTSIIKDGSIWKKNSLFSTIEISNKPLLYKYIMRGGVYLVRWTSNFDCGYETNWWYVIKDTPFDIESLKAKRRYEINKGIKNFLVKIIDPKEYLEELYEVQLKAFEAYPKKYRPKVNRDAFIDDILLKGIFFGAFSVKDNKLCGYAYTLHRGKCIDFDRLMTNPRYESLGVNAALIFGLLEYYKDDISNGKYICDGSRSVNHETKFQDYLEKYFGFRKAYCRLHIIYKFPLWVIIKVFFPFRKVFAKFDNNPSIHLLNALLKMESLYRLNNKENRLCLRG